MKTLLCMVFVFGLVATAVGEKVAYVPVEVVVACGDCANCPNACPAKKGVLQVPVTVEVKKPVREAVKKTIQKTKRVLQKIPCATCPSGWRMDWVEVPLTAEELKAEQIVDKFAAGKLTEAEVADAKEAGLKEKVRAVIGQRWSVATCQMICLSHGSQLYNLFNDGTQELAKPEQQPGGGEVACENYGGWGSRRQQRKANRGR